MKYLHAAHDIDGLRLRAVACVIHVNNGHREVNVEASLAKISFAEHLEVWSEEILRQEFKKTTIFGLNLMSVIILHFNILKRGAPQFQQRSVVG